MTRTVAAIDCGTNSIRLLVIRQDGDGLHELTRQVRLARLGQGVDATGAFHPDALARAFAVCEEFAEIIQGLGVDETRMVATSAARDVSNRDEFFDGVRARLGVDVDVISGDEEARLSASGVASGIQVPEPFLVFDIGGGSTELVVMADAEVRHAISVNVGAVRVKERFLVDDPPTAEQQAAARAFIGELLDGSGTNFAQLAAGVGVAGTVTSVAAAQLGLQEYSRDAVHGVELTQAQLRRHLDRWLSQPSSVTETEPCMHPLRASVIASGALIADEIVARLPGQRFTVSETDILDGIALQLVNQ